MEWHVFWPQFCYFFIFVNRVPLAFYNNHMSKSEKESAFTHAFATKSNDLPQRGVQARADGESQKTV